MRVRVSRRITVFWDEDREERVFMVYEGKGVKEAAKTFVEEACGQSKYERKRLLETLRGMLGHEFEANSKRELIDTIAYLLREGEIDFLEHGPEHPGPNAVEYIVLEVKV